jgi:hypothetical protein
MAATIVRSLRLSGRRESPSTHAGSRSPGRAAVCRVRSATAASKRVSTARHSLLRANFFRWRSSTGRAPSGSHSVVYTRTISSSTGANELRLSIAPLSGRQWLFACTAAESFHACRACIRGKPIGLALSWCTGCCLPRATDHPIRHLLHYRLTKPGVTEPSVHASL